MATERRGQALMELAVGMFALALVVSALFVFVQYVSKSLRAQNELRKGNGGTRSRADTVEVGDFAAANFTGVPVLKIEEKVVLPERTILR